MAKPVFWLNPQLRAAREVLPALPLQFADVVAAEQRLLRFAPLLARLFADLSDSRGIIESGLRAIPAMAARWCTSSSGDVPRLLLKEDNALPVAGSVKARGGVHEVLCFAEKLAFDEGLLTEDDSYLRLDSLPARRLFPSYTVAVGSTGNLGISVGLTACALGLRARVHLSRDAKAWKREFLRRHGVEVVEHEGDFSEAVARGRAEAEADPHTYFIDDENSERLFLGYSVAALRLKDQLAAMSVPVDAEHPLFVYLPCGVGGAPGGITFGLKHLFGDDVHCFLAEPVQAPSALLALCTPDRKPPSVFEIGLSLDTEADGLAVGRASELAMGMVRRLVSGCYTLTDSDLFGLLWQLGDSEDVKIEPSAAAGLRGPLWLLGSEKGRAYLEGAGLSRSTAGITHLVWATGGCLMAPEAYRLASERGRLIYQAGEMSDQHYREACGP